MSNTPETNEIVKTTHTLSHMAAKLTLKCEELEQERDDWKRRARESHAEMMAMKERLMNLADSFGVDAASHRKLSDLGQTEMTKICHRSAWDAYKNAERRVMDAVHNEAAF